MASRPNNDRVLHSKFILKKNRSENGEVKKYKPRFVVCGKEEEDNDKISSSPASGFTVGQ